VEDSHARRCLEGDAPVIAASDYVRAWPQLIAEYVDAPYITLGTDGFGRSDTRQQLRRFFEVDRFAVVMAALYGLVRQGRLPKCWAGQGRYGIEDEGGSLVSMAGCAFACIGLIAGSRLHRDALSRGSLRLAGDEASKPRPQKGLFEAFFMSFDQRLSRSSHPACPASSVPWAHSHAALRRCLSASGGHVVLAPLPNAGSQQALAGQLVEGQAVGAVGQVILHVLVALRELLAPAWRCC
jgi:hypothetical protein